MKNPSAQSGFTLVELLISATIFAFIVTGVTGLFAQALALQRQANGMQKVQTNALFILESIAREVRVSTVTTGNTDCSAGPSAGTTTLAIVHPINGPVTYLYDSVAGAISRNGQQINASGVKFIAFAFCISGSGADGKQVRVTMPMTIQSTVSKQSTLTSVSLQTTIVSRDLSTDPIP